VSSNGVFLSYASQDADAARRIREALMAAGIEVWFDQSELRGGDAWDASIRKQIKACALFIPVISRNTHAREEGYFRLEWKLAIDRSHLMRTQKAFLLPVVIDDSRNGDEVPEKFREVQWTYLPNGQTSTAFVERVSQLLLPGARAPTSTGAAARPKARWWARPGLLAVAAVVVVATGYLVVHQLVPPKRAPMSEGPSLSQTNSRARSTAPEKSIAVLPFVDMSENKDQEYFSDGLSEELIDLLAQVPDLRVPARTSSFYFKNRPTTIAEIAAALNVANVLEGSVRKSGDAVRITVQLIRADNGYHLWSETYDRRLYDIFKTQDEIAAVVVKVLKGKLLPERQLVNAHRTSNIDAYTQYLLGRSFGSNGTRDGLRSAVKALGKAIELDPAYAAAYADLAVNERKLADYSGDAEGIRRATDFAERAIALAPDLADGYAARGFVRYTWYWDWPGAQADLEKALAIDDRDPAVQRHYAGLLAALGRLPEAIAACRKATEADPLSGAAWSGLGADLYRNGELQAARQAFNTELSIRPQSNYARWNLGIIELIERRPQTALEEFRRTSESVFTLSGVALAEHSLGDVKQSQQALEELIRTRGKDSAFQIAQVYAWRGEKDNAFDWLERAYVQRDGALQAIKIDVPLTSLRGDPRYKALLRKMNLPE
jgi:TolB-like protein